MKKLILLLVLLLCPAWADEPDHADHEALRALLKGATEAVNTGHFENLHNYFHDQLRITTINQETITKPEKLEPYYRDWVGPNQYCKSLAMTMTPDDLTEFYGAGDNRFGVVRGGGTEDYDLKDGRHLPMKTRWTATVVKDKEGKWKILALHIGANFYNNPIVDEFAAAAKKYAALGAVGGLLVGGLIGFLVGKKSA